MSRYAVTPAPRPWYMDALAALAFIAVGLGMGKGAGRILGIFGGLFFLAVTLGLGYWFGRTAWNGLLRVRGRHQS